MRWLSVEEVRKKLEKFHGAESPKSPPVSVHPPACKHGVYRGDGRFIGAWNAPFSECRCCGVTFPYIDSGWASDKGIGGRSWTKDRCAQCGGHYVEYGTSVSGS